MPHHPLLPNRTLSQALGLALLWTLWPLDWPFSPTIMANRAPTPTPSPSPFPPSDRSPTGQGGGSRNPCNPGEQGVTPLALTQAGPSGSLTYWGYTEQAQPTLWVYLPYERIARLRISLRPEAEAPPLYEARLEAPPGAGIIAIPLTAAPELTPGEAYQWHVLADVYCGDNPNPKPDRAIAWIQRRPVEAANATDWIYDRLQTAATEPLAWQQLLRSLGQGAIADRPRLDCCQPRP